MNARIDGFTLWELLVTLLVAGILFGFGVPNFMEFQRNGAMVAAVNDLVSGTLTARGEAVKRQVFVSLCLSADPTAATPGCLGNPGDTVVDATEVGFVVWVDESGPPAANGAPNLGDATDGNGLIDAGETLLLQHAGPTDVIGISANCGHVVYRPNGFPRDFCPGVTRTVLYCDDRGNSPSSGQLSAARAVRIDAPGRAQTLQEVAEITAAIANLNADGVAPTCP